jgi:hypothetical protein
MGQLSRFFIQNVSCRASICKSKPFLNNNFQPCLLGTNPDERTEVFSRPSPFNFQVEGKFLWTLYWFFANPPVERRPLALAAVDDQGASHFVEVERDTDKNIEQRQSKWRNFYQASGGKMFVVCDNRSCMRNIRSEINYCLGNRSFVASLTNLADLQAGKRGEGDSIWLEARNIG